MADAFWSLLPTALAVALSPIPIVAIVLILGTPRAGGNGPAFAAGWVAGLSAVGALVLLVLGSTDGASEEEGVGWMQLGIGAAFLVMALLQWRKRPAAGTEPEPPGWMATIDGVTAGRATGLGLALSGANPKNLALTLAAAATIAEAGLSSGEELAALAAFVAIGSASVLGPVLAHAIAPGPTTRPLGAIKGFMTRHSATVMAIVLVLIGAKLLAEGLSTI